MVIGVDMIDLDPSIPIIKVVEVIVEVMIVEVEETGVIIIKEMIERKNKKALGHMIIDFYVNK